MADKPVNVSLFGKLAAIAAELQGVQKDAKNEQLHYTYASPGAVFDAVKPVMAKYKVAMIPSVIEVTKEDTGSRTKSGQATILTRVELRMTFLDGETGESFMTSWFGEGSDWSDKGLAKSVTIAVRTFFLNAFQIPSDEPDTDPDRYDGRPRGEDDYRDHREPAPRQQTVTRPTALPTPRLQEETPTKPAVTKVTEDGPAAWDAFNQYAIRHLRKIGIDDKYIDEAMKLQFEELKSVGSQYSREALSPTLTEIRSLENGLDLASYVTGLSARLSLMNSVTREQRG